MRLKSYNDFLKLENENMENEISFYEFKFQNKEKLQKNILKIVLLII
jgi:hypothetical protein